MTERDVISTIRGDETEETPEVDETADAGTDETSVPDEAIEIIEEEVSGQKPETEETALLPEADAGSGLTEVTDEGSEKKAGPELINEDRNQIPESEPEPEGTESVPSEVLYVIGTETEEPESTPEVISDVL